jgi:hypothetical protein
MVRVRSAAIQRVARNTEASGNTSTPVAQKSADSRLPSERKSHGSNRNGHDVLPIVGGPSIFVRRFREITSALMAEQGGPDRCSASRKQLIRRFAAAAVLAEQMEAQLVRGENIDIKNHALLCSTMVSVARHLGVDQVARNVTRTLTEYLELRAQQEEPE